MTRGPFSFSDLLFYARALARQEPRTPTLSEYHSARVPLYWLKPSMVGERGPTPEPALKLTGECWRITIHKQGWKQPPSRRCIHKFIFLLFTCFKGKKKSAVVRKWEKLPKISKLQAHDFAKKKVRSCTYSAVVRGPKIVQKSCGS